MTTALIDGDIVAYRAAASAEKDSLEIALIRAGRTMKDIVSVVGANEIKTYLSGSRNFRHDICPEYKANRRDMVRPQWLNQTKEYLVTEWGAEVTDGYEADDALGIASTENGGQAYVCSIDKDLLQIPGLHYNFVNSEFSEINEIEGWKNFYSQIVLGDRGDNVPGYDGKMRPKWPKFLAQVRADLGCGSSRGMYEVVKRLYQDDEATLLRNARLLYIWRKENDLWYPPEAGPTSSGARLETAEKFASTTTTQEESIPFTEPTGTQPKPAGFQ